MYKKIRGDVYINGIKGNKYVKRNIHIKRNIHAYNHPSRGALSRLLGVYYDADAGVS